MVISKAKQSLFRRTAHQGPKLATLVAASCVLLGLITYDAGAAPTSLGTVKAAIDVSSISAHTVNFSPFRKHSPWNPFNPSPVTPPTTPVTPSPTTTTTTPPPSVVTTTTPPPAVTTTTTPPPVVTTTTTTTTVPTSTTPFPFGTVSSSEPSGLAPPGAGDFPGYTLTYENDFNGASLPSGWYSYAGQPGGDPGAQWASSHAVVSNGMLQLNAWQDPAYNNEWVTGGVCQCGVAQTYGAYFVRSRVTGVGPTTVDLLWPTGTWPPEIDFNETYGGTTSTSATVHWGANNSQEQHGLNIDMTQWHTFGVVWTPSSITYTVDGKAWATVTNTSEIPDAPMTLDIQQQAWCGSGWACPTSPQSTQVDWVAEYSAN